MPALHGVGVLVTRPEHQAAALCQLLEAEGANTIRLAAIEIRPHGDRGAMLAHLGPLEKFDLIVFVSANAVRFGAPLLEQKQGLSLAAVGPATMRALNQAGYRVSIMPGEGFDSEGLLAHPRLQQLAGRRVLLIKGVDGRELLRRELEQRGASVAIVDVYERRRAAPSAAELEDLQRRFQAGGIDVITATSLDIAASLLAMATPELRAQFDRAHWLVPSKRVEAGVRERGLGAPVLVADSAEDQALVDALIRWRSSVSGA